MPLPLAIPLAIAGGSAILKLFGAKKSADAAKEAAKIQSAAADRAMALQQQMYGQSRADLAPYRQHGAQGLTALSALMGHPQPQMAPPPLEPGQVKPSAMGGMVMLRAPNGQTRAVPAHQVDYYLARGATRG